MPPTLTLSLLDESSIPAFAAVDDAAMASWPYAQAMGLGLPGPRIEMVERWVRHGLLHDSTQTYLRVCDEGSGEMVAGALWRFAPAGEEGAGGREEEGEEGDVEGQSEGERRAAAFGWARREMWEAFRAGFFGGGEAYANLQILVTIPRYRRQGAASQLIEWGTKRADERGLKCVLMASEAGLGAYLKHGFKVVREVEMDLRPYGVDATELRRWMVREPRKAG